MVGRSKEKAGKAASPILIFLIALIVLATAAALVSCGGGAPADPEEPEETEEVEEEAEPEEEAEEPEEEKEKQVDTDIIKINTQSSIRIEGSRVIYFDPYKIEKASHDADMILITHAHYDHFDETSIMNVMNKDTLIVCPKTMKGDMETLTLGDRCSYMDIAGELEFSELGITVESFPAYNETKSYHPKKNGWLSYLVTMDGITYYDEGDTDAIEEHGEVDCDVLFVPIGGTYTMDAGEAAKDANKIEPEIAIPIHYGSIVGSKADIETFKAGLDKDIKCVTKVEDAR